MAARPIFTAINLLFTAGAALLLFFILLGGTKESTPLNELYWLQANTSAIPGAPSVSRWTLYGICQVNDRGRNTNCTHNVADFAFQPARTFNTTTGVPYAFIENHDTYYYLTRFAFPFFLIGLFFTIVTLFTASFGFVSRLGAAISGSAAFIAFVFVITASCLETAVFTLARNNFNNGATLGVKLVAFTWTATTLLLLVTIFACIGCCAGRNRDSTTSGAFGGPLARESSFEKSTGSRRRGFFKVGHKKTHENSFFAENESQNPVMQETSSFDRIRD